MTTITVNKTAGISLTSAAYTNPIVISSGVMISNTANSGNGVYATTGYWAIQNDGSITSAGTFGDGISLVSGGAVTNAATASITGVFQGVYLGDYGTVANDGSIAGAGTSGIGVYLRSGGSVTNAASASITGVGVGVGGSYRGDETVVNGGSIAGTGTVGVGVSLGSGSTVTNATSASIEGVQAGVIIGGDTGPGNVVNYGSIAGTGPSGVGVDLSSGSSVTNAASASITGVDGGVGSAIAMGPQTVVNDGSIEGTGGTGVSLISGSVTNAASASITGATGVSMSDTFFYQTGTVINYGSIAGTSGYGVDLQFGGLVTNAASASVTGATGIHIAPGRSLLGFLYNNGTVINAGSIVGTGASGSGVDVFMGSVTNDASAAITGATGVFIGGSITGVPYVYVLFGHGTVLNEGSISGTGTVGAGVYLGQGSVTNAASASITGATGVVINGGGAVVNGGSIAGTGVSGSGVALYYYMDVVTNLTHASITGDAFGVDFSAGGTLTNAGTVIGNSGTAAYFGGTSSNLLVLDPGYGLSGVAMGGTSATNTLELASAASAGTLSGLGTEFVGFGQTKVDANASWTFNGANTIEAGGTLTELSGATLTVTGTLVNDGSIIIDPSTLTAGGLTGTGLVTIDAGSTLQVQGAVAGGQTLMFGGSGAYLDLDNPGSVAGSITNFGLDETIYLKGVDYSSVSYSHGLLSFSGGSFLLSLANPGSVMASPSGDGAAVTVLCFCVNTLILTPSGERPVQELAVGDMVTTHRGEARRIVWIGTGKLLATQGRRNAATPVIVRQGALGDNVPNRDLRVTKGHSFYIDDVLIPVEFLVNHRSILWDDNAQEVELYHIELETHDVLLANGAPAESYHDDGNRWLFCNANRGWGRPPQTPCAPVLTGGPIVHAALRRLLERAGPRPGLPGTDEPDLHLLVDGRRVDAASRSDEWHVFHLPAPPTTARIVSRSGAPQEMGLARDPRCLGVALRQIMVTRGAQVHTIEAEDVLLADGFHEYEADNDIRWTDGDAAIPAGLFEGFTGPLEINLRLGGRTSYLDEGSVLRAA